MKGKVTEGTAAEGAYPSDRLTEGGADPGGASTRGAAEPAAVDHEARPLAWWRWLAAAAPLGPVLAATPLVHHQHNTVRWIAWGLGVVGGALLLVASVVGRRSARGPADRR